MPHIKILNDTEKRSFNTPPEFNSEERKKYLRINDWEMSIINTFGSFTNKIGFVLQYKYFKYANKFYNPKNIGKKDIEYIANYLEIPLDKIDFSKYVESSFKRHQAIILNKIGIKRFDTHCKKELEIKAIYFCSNQLKPRYIFDSLIQWLKDNKIEIPSYYVLSEIITDTLKNSEKNLVLEVNKDISPDVKKILDGLLEIQDNYIGIKHKNLIRYKVSFLKKYNHSMSPGKIKENINDLKTLKSFFDKFNPIIDKLKLSPKIVEYYAQVLIKSQVFQISRRNNSKYLYLICFIIHQYNQLNDILIEKLQQSTQTNINSCLRLHKDELYEERQENQKKISEIYDVLNDQLEVLNPQNSSTICKADLIYLIAVNYKIFHL